MRHLKICKTRELIAGIEGDFVTNDYRFHAINRAFNNAREKNYAIEIKSSSKSLLNA